MSCTCWNLWESVTRVNKILTSLHIMNWDKWHNSQRSSRSEQEETWWRLMCNNEWWACWRREAGWLCSDCSVLLILGTDLCVCLVCTCICLCSLLWCRMSLLCQRATISHLMDCVWLRNSAWLDQNDDLGVTLLPAHHSVCFQIMFLFIRWH